MDFNKKRTWGPTPNYPLVEKYVRKTFPNNKLIVIGGPCSIESTEQVATIISEIKRSISFFRGGVFRAGTFPGKNFGWIDEELIANYYEIVKNHEKQNIIELLDYSDESFKMINKYADCFQIGCRQMQNYTLLRKAGATGKPVFLKRHPGSTLDEFLGAAEHVLTAGCEELYLIERGSFTGLNHVRWDLSISMIPAIKLITQIPILVDSSHGTGRADLVERMAMAGVAAGADGVLIEAHPDPKNSLSDADQAIDLFTFNDLIFKLKQIKTLTEGI
jgi:3-deoxy-7-phosphoheptulonate synthase